MRRSVDVLAQEAQQDLELGFFSAVAHFRQSRGRSSFVDERLRGWCGKCDMVRLRRGQNI